MTFHPTHYWGNKRVPVRRSQDGFWQDETGALIFVVKEQLEPIAQEEPVTIESGKRYRWIVEGTGVNESASGHGIQVGGHGLVHYSQLLAGKLELIPDPLPTTPGSVISVNGFAYARTEEDVNGKHWAGLMGSDRGGAYSDAEFADDDVTVKFDAGADK